MSSGRREISRERDRKRTSPSNSPRFLPLINQSSKEALISYVKAIRFGKGVRAQENVGRIERVTLSGCPTSIRCDAGRKWTRLST